MAGAKKAGVQGRRIVHVELTYLHMHKMDMYMTYSLVKCISARMG